MWCAATALSLTPPPPLHTPFFPAPPSPPAGNPLQVGSPYRIEVVKRIKSLKKLDGIPIEPEERDAAAA